MKPIRTYADKKDGCWAIWIFRFGLFLKAPRCRALFSERNGLVSRVPLGFGWRFVFRRQDFPF